jgi:ribose transport system substrate-binding protein
MINRYPNLLVIQTLSKSRSLAGMRIGFAAGQEHLIEALSRIKNSINSYVLDRVALSAAEAAIKDVEYFDETRHKVICTRDKTIAEMRNLGFTIPDSAANFIFASHKSFKAEEIFYKLKEKGILVRYFASPRIDNYLRISIASQVNGIIICPDGSDRVTDLINEAAKAGIPVITILNDDFKSKRVSFVGMNSYQLGLIYGEQIFKQITKDTKNIYILFHSSESNSMNDVVFNQIKKTVNQQLNQNNINIQPYFISNDNEFDSEEAIRDIFITADIIPDILVCMEEVDTECACQTIVDYNKVGKTSIIGSYSSDIILEAIKKNLGAITVAMDTSQLGKQSVQALVEYQEMGYVNNFYNVDLHIINKENVDSYISDKKTDKDD